MNLGLVPWDGQRNSGEVLTDLNAGMRNSFRKVLLKVMDLVPKIDHLMHTVLPKLDETLDRRRDLQGLNGVVRSRIYI